MTYIYVIIYKYINCLLKDDNRSLINIVYDFKWVRWLLNALHYIVMLCSVHHIPAYSFTRRVYFIYKYPTEYPYLQMYNIHKCASSMFNT